MITLGGLCRDLFLLAQAPLRDPNRGRGWEDRIAEYLANKGVRTDTLPGGSHVLGCSSLSGLGHQVDGTMACRDAIVIGEWKAHKGAVPKNELLRFKGVTDDYYLGMRSAIPALDLFRIFGGPGVITKELRRYGAIHGITLIDRDRWPAPVLASGRFRWGSARVEGPSCSEQAHLSWLSRPLQQVMRLQRDGSYVIARPLSDAQLQAALDVHERWSDRLWEEVDNIPGRFEAMLSRVHESRVAA